MALAAILLLHAAGAAQAGLVPSRVDEVVNVRAGRGVETPRVLRLAPGEEVLARDCADGWCAVSRTSAPDAPLGYVLASLLKPRERSLATGKPVAGAEITLTPAVDLGTAYDSNIMFQDVSDMLLQASPTLTGKLRTDNTVLNLRAAADVLRYFRYGEFDRMNRECSVNLWHAATRQTRLELNGRARSDHTFESALEESGEVAVKNPHQTYAAQPALAYRLDERTRVRLGGEAVINRYPQRPQNDVLSRGGFLDLARDLAEGKLTLLGRAGFTSAAYETGTQDTATLAAGMDWKISETLSWLLSAGPALSRDRFATPDDRNSHLNLAGETRLRLALERYEAEIGAELGENPGASGEDNVRRRLLAKATAHLTERLDLLLAGTWQRSTTRGLLREQNNAVFSLTPSLRYALAEYASLKLEYGYTCIDDAVAEVYRQRQQIALSLHLEYPTRLR